MENFELFYLFFLRFCCFIKKIIQYFYVRLYMGFLTINNFITLKLYFGRNFYLIFLKKICFCNHLIWDNKFFKKKSNYLL